ncbi:hypothetical protein P153DRAFT_387254 [Dothidotthia symphoricarpi CBS 119687]|uniref:BZIP domain-containing protein n=1 Tax=Dothidotthia symphoricarpi CBS 119687 TaxID=1392245 RepID=A0A6A6AA03_9PLEO|nr:uncharacterized protein P153DRAFT_387254 [Dothidotthia symphoricarpi CBS 119687]KAF2127511.1 hypothetical protein P153DRAFT_387254 [Dothidotthia symphoricarpi CBS 119687]
MTTGLLGMQSLGGPRYCDSPLDLKLASEISNLYSTQDSWACPPRGSQPSMTTTAYMDFSTPNLSSSDGQFRHDSMFQHNGYPAHDDESSHKQTLRRAYTDFVSRPESTTVTAPLEFSASPMFTATNLPTNTHNATMMTPLVTHFDQPDASPDPNGNFSFDEQSHSTESHNFVHLPTGHDQPPLKQRRRSVQTSQEALSPTESLSSAGRRRKSEYAEPGSARAIYLEKNRKAASKCRNKQKRQQDDLVEMARDVERRNRFLKAEVELLRAGMRELMEVVGKHNECPDSRLRSYVQREANRLVAGNQRTAVFTPPSKSSSSDGMSPHKTSSP